MATAVPVAPSPRITDPLPPDLALEVQAMSKVLDAQIPGKQLDRNLLIGTWNLREFGGVTPKWLSEKGDTPQRDMFSIRAIAEVVSRFDVMAIQEVQENIEALRMLIRALGHHWGLILTDAVKSQAGDRERLAFVFDARRVRPSGLACELVVPDEQLAQGVAPDALKQQFAKTPYGVAFRSESQTFILVTLHIKFGAAGDPAARRPELKAIAKWMRDWADDTADELNQNLMCLGDFNIDRKDDENFKAFTSEGLTVPDKLMGLPRTLPTTSNKPTFFDQIAWFTEDGRAKLTLDYSGEAGTFKWDDFLFTDLDRTAKSFRISDHYPLWCEFVLPD
jgi:endonuclease/exonuclease/phosphatase family metal-dependent hydrolase